ncbi:MAG: hypothetical protein IJV82_03080 [Oscillospiraceae bacterium]|nr:hypothetical protein [Oscillospiraceae bacterium]
MGLFDIFKKKPVDKKLLEKCSECFRPIDGHIWRLDNKKYCQECYNRKMAIIQQTAGQTQAENNFKFFIKDVYFLKDRGVVVEGIISSGLIRTNDKVAVNGKSVSVRGIKVKTGLIEQAKASNETVALLLDEKDSADCFKAGGILTTEQCAGTSSNANTFICDVCRKEFPIKYRHTSNTCVECKEAECQNKNVQITNSKAEDISAVEYLDDITFIREIKHISAGLWHQYDVLLAAHGYGWDMMKDWADYMADADLEHISQVTTSSLGIQEKDITKSYIDNGGRCKNTPELNVEMGVLSVAGMSKTLRAPMKIVWLNQTQVLRFFTLVNDELLIKKYVETTIRRTFETENAMKLGKPIPERQ